MKIDLDIGSQNRNKIEAYSTGRVVIAGIAYAYSILLTPENPVQPWSPQRFEDLTAAHFEAIAACAPEIVLVGTGRQLRFPASDLLAPLTSRRIGLEIMDTGAVCRSYNFLLGEGRQVTAALLMIEG